jgi:plastocyanin domain-containing protein
MFRASGISQNLSLPEALAFEFADCPLGEVALAATVATIRGGIEMNCHTVSEMMRIANSSNAELSHGDMVRLGMHP